MYKQFKVRLYPNKIQEELINKTIGCSRFIYNIMLSERMNNYELFKNDNIKRKNKSVKEYKQEYEFLSEPSFGALHETSRHLDTAYMNFFRNLKKGKVGFPKFKSKKRNKLSYTEQNCIYPKYNSIEIKDNYLKMLKVGRLKFRGLSSSFNGIIKFVTVEKTKTNKYYASILVEKELDVKLRKYNCVIGLDLGLKEFIVTSNNEYYKGIKDKLYDIEKRIKHISKIHCRKQKGSKRKEKIRLRLAKLYEYKTNVINHFQWNLVNKLCSENQTIVIEDLNISEMIKNKQLSHSIYYSNWGGFRQKLESKSKEYSSEIFVVDKYFPSSKTCSKCGNINKDLTLSDRIYVCECGLSLDRDYNASLNLENYFNNISDKLSDYNHREQIRPKRVIVYNFSGKFNEVIIYPIGEKTC
jgi:putative transposase